MWIPDPSSWHSSHTELSKYFIERLKQKVDPQELISNKHRTSNGYTLIAEIISVAENALIRDKTQRRLQSLLEEATSLELPFSIPNDYILQTHFSDIITYYSDLQRRAFKGDDMFIRGIIINSKTHLTRLNEYYYDKLVLEVNDIDYSSIEFNRTADIIDKIIDCLLPYLFFQGYSIKSIDDICSYYANADGGNDSPKKIIDNYNGSQNEYEFIVVYNEGLEEVNSIIEFLENKDIQLSKHDAADRELFEGEHEDKKQLLISYATIDPHSFIRDLYDRGLKMHVRKKDRYTLNYFTDFVENVYWRKTNNESDFATTSFELDPISVPKRRSTLRYTLEVLGELRADESLPFIESLQRPTYFYNLALGSKSIENSLFLLWSSLEILTPYRLHKNDIQNVQHFVSTSLGVGSIMRDITSLMQRMITTNNDNKSLVIIKDISDELLCPNKFQPTSDEFIKWADWLCVKYGDDSGDDPYNILKANSELLCRQYCKLNSIFNGTDSNNRTISYFKDKISSSELAVKHQLDRIYLHRNQIVHSGKFLNEYSNLWSHLEWYTGKLLAYSYSKINKEGDDNNVLERIFMELEADAHQLKNIIDMNRDKPIIDIRDSFPLLFKHVWQSF